MGREIRRVPAGWQHPRDERGRLIPLLETHEDVLTMIEAWVAKARAWEAGRKEEFEGYAQSKVGTMPYWEWNGGPPDPNRYAPNWPEAERTHYQLYETVSEGTPLSPAYATQEELADWCAENHPGDENMPRDAWLRFITIGWAPSMMLSNGVLESGVAYMAKVKP